MPFTVYDMKPQPDIQKLENFPLPVLNKDHVPCLPHAQYSFVSKQYIVVSHVYSVDIIIESMTQR